MDDRIEYDPSLAEDPFKFAALCWPSLSFYDRQVEVIESVRDNIETYVPAGNMLGKDFVGGFIAVWFFISRFPCRIITTSAKDEHLDVLWGEIRKFITSSVIPLDTERGGPLIVHQREIKKLLYDDTECPTSYVKGMVANPDRIAAMQGHHVPQTGDGIPRSLFIADECSSVPHDYYGKARTWFNRGLFLGNTWPCENFFKWAVKGEPGGKLPPGDVPMPDGRKGYYRKIIRIKADDSPNVRLAKEEIRLGKQPSHQIIIPGVKPYTEYLTNRMTMNEAEQCVILDADWYEGEEVKLYPPEWLNRAEELYDERVFKKRKLRRVIGCDPGEGGEPTVWYVIDDLAILQRKSLLTKDTADIPGITIALINEFDVDPSDVLFDRGGGGKQHVDTLRRLGYNVDSVSFGESAADTEPSKFRSAVEEKDADETRSVYKNRRAEMYGLLRGLIDPKWLLVGGERRATTKGFGISKQFVELRRQLSPLPLLYDGEGKLYLPPKDKISPNYKGLTIKQLLGCSPNEADALVLAVFRLVRKPKKRVIGAVPLAIPGANPIPHPWRRK